MIDIKLHSKKRRTPMALAPSAAATNVVTSTSTGAAQPSRKRVAKEGHGSHALETRRGGKAYSLPILKLGAFLSSVGRGIGLSWIEASDSKKYTNRSTPKIF